MKNLNQWSSTQLEHLYFNNSIKSSKGTEYFKINNFNELNELVKSVSKTDKLSQPILSVLSHRSIFEPTNLYFIDVDSKTKVDQVIDYIKSEFDGYFSNVLFAQKSFNNKLHIVCYGELANTEDEYFDNSRFYLLNLINIINEELGINYFNEEHAIDLHNCNSKQCLFLSHNELHINSNIKISGYSINSESKHLLFQNYKVLPKNDNVVIGNRKEQCFENMFEAYSPKYCTTKLKELNNKIQINLHRDNNTFSDIFGENGADSRLAFATALTYVASMHGVDKIELYKKYFNDRNNDEIISVLKEPIAYNVKHYTDIMSWIMNNITTQNKLKFNDWKIIDMDQTTEGELFGSTNFVSDRKDIIMKEYDNEKNVYICAPTGTGKSTLLKKLVNDGRKIYVVTPTNFLTDKLYSNNNWINCLIDGKSYDKNRSNCSNYNKYILNRDKISNDTIIVFDEIHILFNSEYRGDVFREVVRDLKTKHIICLSATPSIEVNFIKNCSKFMFIKNRLNRVRMVFNKANNFVGTSLTLIKENIDKYDHIIVNTDYHNYELYINAFMVFNKFYSVSNLLSSNREAVNNNKWNSKIVIASNVSEVGFNIHSGNENILYISDHQLMCHNYSKIIQLIGRERDEETHIDSIILLSNGVVNPICVFQMIAADKFKTNTMFNISKYAPYIDVVDNSSDILSTDYKRFNAKEWIDNSIDCMNCKSTDEMMKENYLQLLTIRDYNSELCGNQNEFKPLNKETNKKNFKRIPLSILSFVAENSNMIGMNKLRERCLNLILITKYNCSIEDVMESRKEEVKKNADILKNYYNLLGGKNQIRQQYLIYKTLNNLVNELSGEENWLRSVKNNSSDGVDWYDEFHMEDNHIRMISNAHKVEHKQHKQRIGSEEKLNDIKTLSKEEFKEKWNCNNATYFNWKKKLVK